MYQVLEISTHKDNPGFTYVLVDFGGGVKEEFLMQLATEHTRIVTDVDGNWQRADGVFVKPPTSPDDKPVEWMRETVPADVKAQILANLDRFEQRNVVTGKVTGDLTAKGTKAIQRDKSDPQGILADPDVQALVSADVVVAK